MATNAQRINTRQDKIWKRAKELADVRVERAYGATCSGVQISILDIPKIFAFGREKIAAGETDAELGASIRAYVDILRGAELISDAAEAQERFGDDVLEEFAKGRTDY